MKSSLTASAFLLLSFGPAAATTWDEPWQKQIIENSDALVRVKIVKSSPSRVEFAVIKQVAGEKLGEKGSLVGFSMLNFGSYSVKEDVFELSPKIEYYLFVKKAEKKGEYLLPTPTSGFAATRKGTTTATYRHSHHQALVSDADYEMTMAAIFKELKHEKPDLGLVRKYIAEQLAQKPADIPEDPKDEEFGRFCRQHVALETLYYLGGADLAQLEPFLKHQNWHVQTSAVRALGRMPRAESLERLLAFIADPERAGFPKVMAVWALRDLNATEAAPKLREMLKSTKDEETGFGGNIMDPRVATSFPASVHGAIEQVLEGWEKAKKP
ncbi:HEAT repeat domain-containing protein [Prosthecobacter sp.]|uniref:HEAT repeat domain-containing protein n=1 Tax=Prosthecobacter sp. TaxID=1965333 RepID=UPI0037835E4D